MDRNPNDAAVPDPIRATGHRHHDRDELRSLAKSQRSMIMCILVQIGCIGFNVCTGGALGLIVDILNIAVMVASAILIGIAATRLWAKGAGIILAVVSIVPLVGLVILLVVNGAITRTLKRHGIKVGVMGADPAKIR